MSDGERRSVFSDLVSRRQRELLRTLWMQGRLSRWELHEQTGLSPNGVGTLVDTMLRARLIRECAPEQAKMGRPRVPLEIEPIARHLLGVALVPGRAEITRFGLSGHVIGKPAFKEVSTPSALVTSATELLTTHINSDTLAVGITSPGFLDPVHKNILLSSALPGRGEESLVPLFEAAGDTPAVLGNDMHALAARWLLTHRDETREDVLLIWFSDGRLGAAVLVDGRPNRGCMTGGNELGHTRFPGIETEECFCGQTGCLERIVSSPFLLRHDRELSEPPTASTLNGRVAQFQNADQDPSLGLMIRLMAQSVSNAVNFLRVHRVVLVSPYTGHAAFNDELTRQIKSLALPDLAARVKIDLWDQPSAGSAENGGWLVLAELMFGGWDAMAEQSQSTSQASSDASNLLT